MRAHRRWVCVLTAGLGVACGGNTVTTSGTGTAAGGSTGAGGAGASTPTAAECLADHFWAVSPDYDQYNPVMGSHCVGTNHQDIVGVEKLVFLGDSITEGTPPAMSSEHYRTLLGAELGASFPGLEVTECAENGAQVGDLLANQIPMCFPAAEPKRTLVVMTMGGNDVIQWPTDGLTGDQALADADVIAAEFRRAIDWFYADPGRFPAGVFVVFTNVYEFTDGTGELSSCTGAGAIGLSGNYYEGVAALSHLEEQYMKTAAETGSDMVLMLEQFCGHGWMRDMPFVGCALPNPAPWFDFTCIHPNVAGHAALSGLFKAVIEE